LQLTDDLNTPCHAGFSFLNRKLPIVRSLVISLVCLLCFCGWGKRCVGYAAGSDDQVL
jgi:hypothetical protein